MATTSRSFSAGHFNLTLDDNSTSAGYLKSVDGGAVKGSIVEEKIGPEYIQYKHLSTIEIEPVSMEVGMAVSRPLFDWIKASWSDGFQRKSGAIIHGNFDQYECFQQEFTNALISETVFPALDGSVKDPAYLTVKFQPESLLITKGANDRMRGDLPSAQKLWSPANFRLSIDNIDASHVNKIDSISVKQKIKSFHYGTNRHPELEPTGLEFSNVTIYTAMAHAEPFIQWHNDYVVEGDKDTLQEKQGAIEFLNPDVNDASPLFTIKLINMGIFSLSIEKSEANSDSIKRCKIQLYVERMDLQYGGGL